MPRNILEFIVGEVLIPGAYTWICIAQEMEVCVIFHKQLGVLSCCSQLINILSHKQNQIVDIVT